ncbi:MAG: hypothetical protein WBE46_01070 [Dehalococcoidia bacterium]
MIASLEEAEHAVREIFHQEFPTQDFDNWNQNIDDATAENIISTVGKASRINVKRFIEDLW